MKFPTVEKFLCCIRLEWGIFIVAWIYLLFSTVYLIASTIIFIWLVVDYFSLIELIPESYFRDVVENFQPLSEFFKIQENFSVYIISYSLF